MTNAKNRILALALIVFSGWGCASHAPLSSASREGVGVPPSQNRSQIEITYLLGHSRRRFIMTETPTLVSGESYVDRSLLKKTTIDPKRFQDYYARVSEYVKQRRNGAAAPATDTERECRAPFIVVITPPTGASDGDPQTFEGCRQDDPGGFNRLVDEGEFLIYSSK